jgi:hypothetical protein
VTGIVVALGAGQACREYFGEGSGSLIIAPMLANNAGNVPDYPPFTIGDVNPRGNFIHVFDETTLDVVMHELDTVTDFTGCGSFGTTAK